jgi:hypothetical protein
MKKSLQLFFFAIGFIVLASCKNNPAKTAESTDAKKDSTTTPTAVITDNTIKTDVHNKLNDVALYLAGMKPDSFVAVSEKLQKLNYYQNFCDTMNRGFANMESSRLSKMREWAKTEMASELANPKTVFYPFSGPDILHCVNLYPDADQYVMIALEKYGSLPNLEKMDSSRAIATLGSINKSLEDIFGKSYFITRKMLRDVSNQWNGVTPLACVFLVRTGHSILDIKYKHLNDDGSMTEINKIDSVGKFNDLVEIYFKKNGTEKIRKIVYFRTNLCDDPYGGMTSFKDNKPLQNYLNNLPECYTYVKSASYLMNYGTFSLIRNICLNKSKSILQDDTGIAYRYIDKNKWVVKLYGSYVKPVSDFSGVFQDDLSLAYKKDSSSIQKLPFSLGYHWGNQAFQNLMKFEKK